MRAPLLLAALLALGCTREDRASGGGDGFEHLGAEGALFISLGALDWPKLEQLPAELAKSIPMIEKPDRLARDLGELRAEAPTTWAILRGIAMRTNLGDLPLELPGLDATRPILIAAGATLETPEAQLAAIAAGLSDPAARRASGLRHRVVLPASDPRALAEALAPAAQATDERLVRVTPRDRHVVVDIVAGYGLSSLDAAGRDRALGPVDRPRGTPHPLLTGGAPSLARIHLRLDRLADVGASTGAIMVASVASDLEASIAPSAVMQGFSEILTAPVFLDPAAALFTDAILDVPAADPAAAAVYLVATERGRAALAADARLAKGEAVPPAQLDLAAIVAASPTLARGGSYASARDLAEPVQECGFACAFYLGLGNGLVFLRAAEAIEPGSMREVTQGLARFVVGGRVTLAGTTLVVEPLRAAEGAAARARPVTARAVAAGPAHACYLDALAVLRRTLAAAVDAPGGDAAPVLDRFTAEAATHLDCASKDPPLADRVAAIRAAVASLRAVRRSPDP